MSDQMSPADALREALVDAIAGEVIAPEGYDAARLDAAVRKAVEAALLTAEEWGDAEAEKRGAVKALARLAEEIDEDKRYPGFDLVMWLTGLQNSIESGEVTL